MKVPKHPDRAVIIASIDDAEHFSKEQKDQIIASYPAHEREARVRGNPVWDRAAYSPLPKRRSPFLIEHSRRTSHGLEV
jgi:hypothetical protein